MTKLDDFTKGEEGKEGEPQFDVETAVKVCRAAGYYQHALFVAMRAGEHEWYLKILLEDLGRYEEALQYITGLSLYESTVTLRQYGKVLVEHKPAETTAAPFKALYKSCRREYFTVVQRKGIYQWKVVKLIAFPG